MNKLLEELKKLGGDRVRENEPMNKHTTFKVGGCADICFFAGSADEIMTAIKLADDNDVPYYILGNGSNVIVSDDGIRGLVIILSDEFNEITVDNDIIFAQAGATLTRLALKACENGLTGLEFASGIPGTVGGGTAMNAGAYGGEIKNCLKYADVIENGKLVRLSVEEMEMGYRTSRPLKNNGIVIGACFVLEKGDKESIRATMNELNARRRAKQPLNFPSAGSVFKRPEGYFAGALIEQAGLKGATIGGAQVSEKHAGFIINIGGATAYDIKALIRHVQDKVFENSGVRLETEVRMIG